MQTAPKKIVNAWAMYDWANSAYNLVITSTIFPAYYVEITTVTTPTGKNDSVSFFGWHITNTVLQDYALAAVFLIVALTSPILSSIADYRRNKKNWLRGFCYMGSASCIALFWFTKDNIEFGIIAFAIAALGFWSSIVFYNSYLPDIAAPEDQDHISAKGFSLGYIGSVILQIICLVIIFKPIWFGLKDAYEGMRLSFLLTGIWWFGFAQITFSRLPAGLGSTRNKSKKNILLSGFNELKLVWNQVKHMPSLKRFLLSFFLYSMGVQTVMLVAAGFSKKEIFPSSEDAPKLIITILIIQLVAIIGAMAMSRLSKRFGNWWVLTIALIVWIIICAGAYTVKSQTSFYFLAALVGLVMGGIQSLSRSTYSKLLPETKDTTSFFSFYDVTEKIALVIGIFIFGYIEAKSGSMRNSIFALAGFFILAIISMLYTKPAYEKRMAELNQ